MPPDRHASSPLDALWRPGALLAVLLGGEALALVLALAPDAGSNRLVSFGLSSLAIQWIALGVLCALYLLRRPLGRWSALSIAWVCLLLLLVMTALVSSTTWGLLHLLSATSQARGPFIARALTLATVMGLVGLVAYQNYWRARQLAVRAKQLELEALQARIRPHFLFNTLNTVAALVHADPDDAERVLLDLADLFRSALQGPQLVPLTQELDLTRRYLDIEALRLGERLQLDWQLPAVLPAVNVPSLSLQPLAENAIRHGIERRPQGGRLQLHVRTDANQLEVEVSNDLPADGADGRGHAVGLASARERVRALTDGRGRIEAGPEAGRYVARLRLPLPAPPPPQASTR